MNEEYQPLTAKILEKLLEKMDANQRDVFFGPHVNFGPGATLYGRPVSVTGFDPGKPGSDQTHVRVEEITIVNPPGNMIDATAWHVIEDEELGTKLAVR